MRKDNTEFRNRFDRWKNGELVYENGLALPEYKDGKTAYVAKSRSLEDGKPDYHYITDNDGSYYRVYPNVQTVEGQGLIDFTNPIWKGVVNPIWRAIKNNDYVPMKTEQDARWFGPNYKDYYPGFSNGKSPIHIKPSKRGSFTAAAKRRGMSVSLLERAVLNNPDKYSSAMRKKALFSRNARSWKH